MLYLFLVDSALELIPKGIGKHVSIGKNIRRLGDAGKILDSSLHHSIMKTLKNNNARGRPDIIHHFLNDTLSSPLNKWNLLRIFLHTRNNNIFEINPIMRPPRDYNRFKGVFYKLLRGNDLKIPLGENITKRGQLVKKTEQFKDDVSKTFFKPLKYSKQNRNSSFGPPIEFLGPKHFIERDEMVFTRKMRGTLTKIIDFLRPNRVIKLSSIGKLVFPDQIFNKSNPREHLVALIGGFQSGNFSSTIANIKTEDLSIFPMNLESWAVVQRVLINYENFILKSAN
jgi:rRNA pseudouridine-1189 N-methylase Emg1 (Nep1/Mra1 family)